MAAGCELSYARSALPEGLGDYDSGIHRQMLCALTVCIALPTNASPSAQTRNLRHSLRYSAIDVAENRCRLLQIPPESLSLNPWATSVTQPYKWKLLIIKGKGKCICKCNIVLLFELNDNVRCFCAILTLILVVYHSVFLRWNIRYSCDTPFLSVCV